MTKHRLVIMFHVHLAKDITKKNDLWKHQSFCVAKNNEEYEREHVKNGRLLLPVTCNSKELSEKVISTMQEGDVKCTVETDKHIVDFGNRMLKKQGHEQHKIPYISQKLRELGWLLKCCKSVSNVKSIDDVIRSSNWEVLIQCVRSVSGYNEQDHSFETPSLALKLGHSLKKCAKYKTSEAIKENDKIKQEEAERFLTLYESDWQDDISAQALASLEEKKYNKQQFLPLTKDVVQLNNYLSESANHLCKDIENDPHLYSQLAKVCLAQVILFNRRRSGEAERITLKGFNDAVANGSGKPDPVVMSTLNEFEKNLCKSHTRVEIKGKRGRKVPVLFTDKMKENIETLVANRERADVKQPYLFARHGDFKSPYRGSECLRNLVKEANVENPTTLTSTKLRKQLATLAQVLNLSETSQNILATFQGHDIRVHREFYRLPDNASQAAKVTKILHSINNGTIAKYKGKDFDEIEFVAEKEKLESESDSEKDEDSGKEETDGESEDDTSEDDEGDENEVQSETRKGLLKNNLDAKRKTSKETRKGLLKNNLDAKKKTSKVPTVRHKWSKNKKAALERQFKKNINLEKVPGQLECLNAIKQETCLAGFTWKNIKFAVKNVISSRQRSCKK